MTKLLPVLLLLSTPAAAQCCLGAQDATVDSVDGHYRVEARSQTGTGVAAHGPYRFVFTTLRVADDGTTTKLGEFERKWDSKNHFNMTICVSPTGNGFLLGSSLEPDILFFAPNGQVLRKVECGAPQSAWPNDETLRITLYSAGRELRTRQTRLWLPLCHVIGPETEMGNSPREWRSIRGKPRWPQLDDAEAAWLARMVLWSPERGERERAAIEDLLRRFATSDRRAGDELVEFGLSALPYLQAEEYRALRERIEGRLCGHRRPYANRELLTVLLKHPRKVLRDAAQKQLELLRKH